MNAITIRAEIGYAQHSKSDLLIEFIQYLDTSMTYLIHTGIRIITIFPYSINVIASIYCASFPQL